MKPLLPLLLLLAALPAGAQIPHISDRDLVRNAPSEGQDEAATRPPVNLRPTQLLRCPDGKGGFLMQDTPCRPLSTPPAGAAPASAPEIIDLAALPPRPQAEAPLKSVAEAGPSRWTKALHGAGKLALLLAALYAVYRIGRYGRDRLRQRFPEPDLSSRVPRRVR